MQFEVGAVKIPEKMRHESVRFNVIIIKSGWVGVQFPDKSITKVCSSMLLLLVGGGWVSNFQKKRFKGVGFNIIIVTRGCQMSRGKRYKGMVFNIVIIIFYEGVGGVICPEKSLHNT